MKVKNTYLLIVTVIGLFSLALYSTYAMFTASVDIGEFVNLTAATLPADTSMLEYERITLNSGDSKLVDLNITNSTTNSLYYGVWYEMIDPSSKTNDITIAKLDTSTSETIGELSSSTDSKVTLILENFTADVVIINIGVGYSATSSLNLPTNRNIVSDVASEGIDASTLPDPTPVNFDYTGAVQTYTIPSTGLYKLEVWGAQGGSYNSSYASGGKGGYSYGTVTLNEGDTLYIYTGGAGSYSTTSTYTATSGGGFNGGGNAGYRGGAGGGSSDIRINEDSLYSRVIVAGGGGGAYAYSTTYKAAGGVGGGESGTSGSYYSSTYSAWVGGGGTQTAGGTAGNGSSTNYYGKAGTFGTGGSTGYKYNSTSYYSNGAGGGGWYGGGAAGNYSSGSRTRGAGGGGGSGFVYTSSTASNVPSGYKLTSTYYLTDAATVAGNTSFTSPTGTSETGHSNNGYARITGIRTAPSLDGLTDLTLEKGTSHDLLSDVTCVDNGDGCTILKVSVTNISTLAVGEYIINYIVKDNNNQKYKFSRKLIVYFNLDESGANKPKLVDGLIPVMYDETKKSWVKTSSNNDDSQYQWYDYNNKKWANAVLVTATNRSTYQNASNGTEIVENDILAYYVWIPRYKYKVWNITKTIGTDSYDAYHTGIDIVFENGIESSGTITCNYDFTITDGSLSEICSGQNGEYYTHPAFTFGDTEVEGIWVGKFELSSSNTTIDYGGGESTSLTARIKPNVTNWRYNTLSNFILVIQNMQISSNEYGLTTNKTLADSHMIRNLEWGAVAYLTNSNYGRCSGGTCSEVTQNGEKTITGGNDYKSNILQSTTGNIYGVYDMNGGSFEFSAGNQSSTSGSYTYNAQEAGNNFSYTANTAKYIDAYADGRGSNYQTAYNRARLGDCTGEVVTSTNNNGGWYGDYVYFIDSSDPWFWRSGNSGSRAGVFYFNYATGTIHEFATTRASLIVY